jgi:two-component system, chemotaxis family, CheB/CheR fusion protein
VGIGASAGGLDAVTQLLQSLAADTGMAFVFVQHLDPSRESALSDLLGKVTSLPVAEVTHDVVVRPNHVYVIPPDRDLVIAKGRLRLEPRSAVEGARQSIDRFFESLAHDQRECAVGVILSGTATDGTRGLEAIKAEGGLTFAQDASAKYDSMPRSAIAAGCVDTVLSPRDIARELTRIARHPFATSATSVDRPRPLRPRAGAGQSPEAEPTDSSPSAGARRARSAGSREAGEASESGPDADSTEILQLLRRHSGIDFTLYRASTVDRRIHRRMVIHQVTTLERYADLLREDVAERDALHADMLITLTAFFRNPKAFGALKAAFVSLVQRVDETSIRVWVAGCSTGQEAYSLVMAYVEATVDVPHPPRIQVFATDLSRRAVEVARTGRYDKASLRDLSPRRIAQFFEEDGSGRFRVRREIREKVVFAQHDVLHDPPFSHLHLVSCRNLLIYLRPETQRLALSTFARSLDADGILFLGPSESPGSAVDAFETLDAKNKIYSRRRRTAAAGTPPAEPARATVRTPAISVREAALERAIAGGGLSRAADRVSLGRYAPCGVIVDSEMQVLEFRGDTRPWLKLPVGKATFDLRRIVHEGLLASVRSAIREAGAARASVRRDVRVKQGSQTQTVTLEVIPMRHAGKRFFLVSLVTASAKAGRVPPAATTLAAVPAPVQEVPEGTKSVRVLRQCVADLRHDLVEAQEDAHSYKEQHDAVMGEMNYAIEEAHSAAEEMQSINEELEAAKEELESANEELATVNDEMASQNAILTRTTTDLLNTERVAELEIVIIGRDGIVRRMTPSAEAHFGLRKTDLGRPLQAVIDLPALTEPVAAVLESGVESRIELQDATGRWSSVRLAPYTDSDGVQGVVLSFLDIDARRKRDDILRQAREYAEAIVRTTSDPLLILDAALHVYDANEAFCDLFKTTLAEVVGRSIFSLWKGQWNTPILHNRFDDMVTRHSMFHGLEMTQDVEGHGRRTLLVGARVLQDPGGEAPRVLVHLQDITEVGAFQVHDRAKNALFHRLFESSPDGLLLANADTGQIFEANAAMAILMGNTTAELCRLRIALLPLSTPEGPFEVDLERLRTSGWLHHDDCVLTSSAGVRLRVKVRLRLHQDALGPIVRVDVRETGAAGAGNGHVQSTAHGRPS